MPGNGRVAEPGLSTVTPGSGVIRMWPVSVCHQVSTTGQRPPPITFQYQTQASGLIGSPTLPSRRKLDRSPLRVFLAPAHERADGGGRGVTDGHAVLLHDPPEAVLVGEIGRALVHHRRRAIGERA